MLACRKLVFYDHDDPEHNNRIGTDKYERFRPKYDWIGLVSGHVGENSSNRH